MNVGMLGLELSGEATPEVFNMPSSRVSELVSSLTVTMPQKWAEVLQNCYAPELHWCGDFLRCHSCFVHLFSLNK